MGTHGSSPIASKVSNSLGATGDVLHLLLDTNVVIAVEGDDDASHENQASASKLLREVSSSGGRVSILQNQRDDFARIKDNRQSEKRARQLGKYSTLSRIEVGKKRFGELGYSPLTHPRSNDAVDAALLLALQRGVATWLVTEDRGIHAHAVGAGLQDRVMRIQEALNALEALKGTLKPHHAVDTCEPHTLDPNQPFFGSLRNAYKGFDNWWLKAVREGRPCLTIGEGSALKALAVLDRQEFVGGGLPTNSFKICTFKIAEAEQGKKLGETLLDSTILHIRSHGGSACFIEVDRKQEALLVLLREFGFFDLGVKFGCEDELVLGKLLGPEFDQNPVNDPLSFNRRYGPGRRLVDRAFVVPIIPEFHSMLFPATESQGSLFDSTFGNAVRKVYISHSGIKALKPGDALFFLRTRKDVSVHAVGVVETTMRTKTLEELVSFSGSRTVYSAAQLKAMCSKEVLAVKFRLDEILNIPVSKVELQALGVMKESPQSISQVHSEEGLHWARSLQNE